MGKTNDYVARISQATPIDLSIISSEICISKIDEAIFLIDDKTKRDSYHENLNKCKEIILEKIHSCDRSAELGENLLQIFFTINQLIVDGQFTYEKEKLLDAKELIEKQMEIFKIAKKDGTINDSQKVINTSEKIIAGLTYSNGKLDEFVDITNQRTFNA